MPEAGEAVLTAPQPMMSAAMREAAAMRMAPGACPGCGTRHVASADQRAEDDPLIAEALADWEADMGPIIKPILKAAEGASSFDEFEAMLDQMQPDVSALARRLAILTMKARGEGDGGR